jgi:hypothetical protein
MRGLYFDPPRYGEVAAPQGLTVRLRRSPCQPLHHRLAAAVPLPVPGRI